MSESPSHSPESHLPTSAPDDTTQPQVISANADDSGAFSVFDEPLPAQKKESDTVISKKQPQPQGPDQSPVDAQGEFELGRFLEGQRLGHFELRNFVGGGGMGAVFRAVDTSLGRVVAVKVLSKNQTDEESIRRFQIEAKSAARLDHDNIARVYYVGEDKGWNYIVFEYIEGENIRDLVRRNGRLPLGEAINYTLQIAEALEHAYSREVVHRDIKPSNIIVTGAGHAKLVDMGLARLQEETPASDLTVSGVTLGTFDYISPEQARDPRLADVRSDLYSLGCTFYFMLTGRPPFPDGTVLQKLLNHSSEAPPDPRRWRPGLPEEVCDILNRMMAKLPKNRFEKPGDVIGRLLMLVDDFGLSGVARPKTVVLDVSQPQPKRWERILPWAAGLVCLAMTLIGAEWYLSGADASNVVFPELQLAAAPEAKPAVLNETPIVPPEPAPGVEPASETDVEPTSVSPDVTPSTPETSIPDAPDLNPKDSLVGPGEDVEPLVVTPDQPVDSIEDPPPAASVVIKTLVIGDESLELAEGEAFADSLAEACLRSSTSSDIRTIELRFNGPREAAPFDATANQTVIMAGAGYEPEIVFHLDRKNPAKGRMIRLLGGRLDCYGVHFRAVLPDEYDYENVWSLFRLDTSSGLTLVNCSLTMENIDAFGGVKQFPASFVSLTPPLKTDSMDSPAMPAHPRIDLSRCIVRGQASLVRAEPATPFRLYWDEGLLATTERLVEFGGSVAKYELDGFIEIDLNRLTIAAERGLVAFQRSDNAPFELGLKMQVRNSILIAGVDSPIVEHIGVSSIETAKKRFAYKGENNFYPQTSVLWSVSSSNPTDSNLSFDFQMARDESWFNEKFPHGMIMWQESPPTNADVHTRTADDFQLSTNPDNPALRDGGAGFDPESLPELPTVSLRPEALPESPVEGD